jgi:hypothetical protein
MLAQHWALAVHSLWHPPPAADDRDGRRSVLRVPANELPSPGPEQPLGASAGGAAIWREADAALAGGTRRVQGHRRVS